MKRYLFYGVFLYLMFFLNGLFALKCDMYNISGLKQIVDSGKPVTIFIHGGGRPMSYVMLFSGFSRDCPDGLHLVKDLSKCCCDLGHKVSEILCSSDLQIFPLESFYIFGWKGVLSYQVRRDAGFDLYKLIKNFKDNSRFKNTPINIITHSHGGNVALNVAEAALLAGDKRQLIDKLIIMGCPVVLGTSRLAKAPTFGKVYNFYACNDMTQVLEPFYNSKAVVNYEDCKVPCLRYFAGRVLRDCPDALQVEIKFNNRSSLGHLGFTSKYFLKMLPQILRFLESEDNVKTLTKDHYYHCLSINSHNWTLGPCCRL